jgi:hypothetical protein
MIFSSVSCTQCVDLISFKQAAEIVACCYRFENVFRKILIMHTTASLDPHLSLLCKLINWSSIVITEFSYDASKRSANVQNIILSHQSSQAYLLKVSGDDQRVWHHFLSDPLGSYHPINTLWNTKIKTFYDLWKPLVNCCVYMSPLTYITVSHSNLFILTPYFLC